ncbi:uncharacterized protein LOC106081167 [Stomoxys calcitrans]|uniref:uncharacterized protein LOC106081167 n=1 Tax=Stomoxys calcitrans TaxID=35570 RepID=UPI0027E2A59A|nr:uncharacterized protein LOC106081167 [Stomoxys calcitrans]XP_059226355.1 uncharacterized protein LOC106081167 [Stomoxys calcitrans]
MAFQRSYSKVWWGSDNQTMPGMNGGSVMNSAIHQMLTSSNNVSLTSGGLYYNQQQKPQQQQQRNQHQPQMQQEPHQQYQSFGGSAYHSLDLHQYKYGGNLSRIQEVEDEHNISKLSWGKHDSPGSLRSQDSGFSDNEEFHHTRSLSGRSSKTSSPSSKSSFGSPQSTRSVETPPTVVRKTVRSDYYTSLVNVSRRITFPASPVANNKLQHSSSSPIQEPSNAEVEDEGPSLLEKLDSMQLMNESPVAQQPYFEQSREPAPPTPIRSANPRIKKRRKVQRKPTTPLSPTRKRCQSCNNSESHEDDSDGEEQQNQNTSHRSIPEYNNETVYLGGPPTCSTPPPPYNNETVVLGGPLEDSQHNNTLKYDDYGVSPLRLHTRFSGHTSTPKALKETCGFSSNSSMAPFLECNEYDNTLLNGHSPDVQFWLDDLRMSYDQEVMSTLQTKSIAQEAIKNLKITTSTVAKFIRQLQQKALRMQQCFERTERQLGGSENISLHEALSGSLHLLGNVAEFTHILERRSVFFAENRLERKRYEDYIDQIRMVHKDTRYSLENQHYINLESLLEDLQVLKRILLIAVRQVYEKLVRILIQSIENGRCDLMLKANINMVATLMNIDYDGFASLIDAFVQTEAVRTLLVVCLDNKSSSVRAQSLRALATICCAPEPIFQLGSCGGIEVIRDILQIGEPTKKSAQKEIKRSDLERREAVSLLTQITAAWHGPDHRVDGLRDCVETVVEGLTRLLVFTECPQTLLLCAAALNNLSRMEITSHYSIMSHETIFKLIDTMESRDEGINVFLYEQIVAMLYNMSLNKKCHSHLANGSIVNFITYAYQTEFYKIYSTRGESEAQQRCIKTILHTLTRLVQDSVLGMELLEQHNHMPSALFYSLSAPPRGQEFQRQQQLYHQQHLPLDISTSREISFLARRLDSHRQQEQSEFEPGQEHNELCHEERESKLKTQLQRQESYV